MVKPINSFTNSLNRFLDRVVENGRATTPEQKQRLRRFIILMVTGIPVALLLIIFQISLYIFMGITQSLYAAGVIFLGIAVSGIAHFTNKAGHYRAATFTLMTAITLIFGGLAFLFTGADYYLFFSGGFLILLIGLLLMPDEWWRWQPPYLILIGVIWLGARATFIEHLNIQDSIILRIFFATITIIFALVTLTELVRHLIAGNIQTRLLVFVAAAAIIPTAIVSTINGVLTQRALTAAAEQALIGAAAQTATAVDTFIENNINLIGSQANLHAFSTYLNLPPEERKSSDVERQARDLLRQLAQLDVAYISSYALLDLDGNNLLDTNANDIGTNEADRSYFQEATRMVQALASDFEVSPTTGGLNIYFSAPVRAVTGHVVGILRVRYNVGAIQQIVYSNAGIIGEQSDPVLLDEYYIRLADGDDPGLVLQPVAPLTQEELDTLIAAQRLPSSTTLDSESYTPTFAEGLRHASEQPVFTSETHPEESSPDSVAVAALHTKPWLIAFYQEREVFLSPMQVQSQVTIVVTLLIVSVVLLAALWVSRLFSRPIIELTKAAESIMAGNLDTTVTVTSQDELGILGQSFNAMTAQLSELVSTLEQRVQQRTAALVTSAETGRRLSTILDETELVHAVVEQVRDAFNYYHVHIYLFDEHREKLLMAGGTGDAGRQMLASGHSLKPDQGLVGKAAVSNSIVLIPDVQDEPSWLPNPLLPETKAEIAVPIIYGDEVLGVLDVQQNIANGLDDNDVDLLQSITTQVAIALRNARLYKEQEVQAQRAVLINDINQKILNTKDMTTAMQVAVRELGHLSKAELVRISVMKDTSNRENGAE